MVIKIYFKMLSNIYLYNKIKNLNDQQYICRTYMYVYLKKKTF